MIKPLEPGDGAKDPLEESAVRGKASWQRFALRIQAVTPAQVMRFLLVALVIFFIGWLAWVARVALLPFILGAVLAYIMLPVVNVLDRFLPRWFASLLTMSFATALIVYFFLQSVPPLARQVINVMETLPDDQQLVEYADQLAGALDSLPKALQPVVTRWLDNVAISARDQLDNLASRGFNLLLNSIFGLFNALGFVFGFLVIPTWLLTVLNEQKKGTAALNRALPQSWQKDFWAIVKIIDRDLRSFVRGQFFISVVVSLLTYLGLVIVARLVNVGGDYLLILALFSGLMALIPTLGALLGSIPVILIGLTVSPQTAIAVTIMYIIVWLLVNNSLTPRIEGQLVDIHPAILVIIIVAVSELGLLWVLLAAPLTGIFRDLFRYVYGRFADPPRPAGLLPYEPLPAPPAASTPAQYIPVAYRHGRAQRSTTRSQ